MTIPNLITIFRIFLIPLYLVLFYSDSDNNILMAGLVFTLAGISDILDGYIARKYDLVSDLGKALDPIADKLMIFTILITFTHTEIIQLWILVVMAIKEFLMLAGGAVLYFKKDNQVVAANSFGKAATVAFYISTFSVILKFPWKYSWLFFTITILLNILALITYLINYIRITK